MNKHSVAIAFAWVRTSSAFVTPAQILLFARFPSHHQLLASKEDDASEATPLEDGRGYAFDARKKAELMKLAWDIRETSDECEVDTDQPVIDTSECGTECRTCRGKGLLQCGYCRGTGFFTIADVLIGTLNDCPVCDGVGEIKCEKCIGTGAIAKWFKPPKSKKR
jgi:hypothetical protein